MTEDEAAAQAELREIAKTLTTLGLQLEGIHHRLPISPEEAAMLLGEMESDISTEVRSVIECVLNDELRPAIRDLQAAASYTPKGEDA